MSLTTGALAFDCRRRTSSQWVDGVGSGAMSQRAKERNMTRYSRSAVALLVLVVASAASVGPRAAIAVESSMIDRETEAALKVLYDTTPAAKELAPKAKAILVFPNI